MDGEQPYAAEFEQFVEEGESVAREVGDLGALADALRMRAFLAGRRGDGDTFARALRGIGPYQ